MTATMVHKFEESGLGLAPFRYVGFERKVGPIDLGNGISCGAPGQPMGTCDYCGTGIGNLYHVVSADGKRFVVGSDCVDKVGDVGLRAAVSAHERDARKAKSAAKAKSDRESLSAMLHDPETYDRLESLPHPLGRASSNLALWAVWMFEHSGAAGIARALKMIRCAS